MDYLIFFAFLCFMAFVVYMSFSKHGRGKMLGGNIVWSGKYHLIDKHKFTGSKSHIQVHAIKDKSDSDSKVGIEVRHTSYGGFSVQPISLTIEQAEEIAKEIQEAIANGRA